MTTKEQVKKLPEGEEQSCAGCGWCNISPSKKLAMCNRTHEHIPQYTRTYCEHHTEPWE